MACQQKRNAGARGFHPYVPLSPDGENYEWKVLGSPRQRFRRPSGNENVEALCMTSFVKLNTARSRTWDYSQVRQKASQTPTARPAPQQREACYISIHVGRSPRHNMGVQVST